MRNSLVLVQCALLCLTVIACNLFKTRTPEEPSQQSSNYVPPTEPSYVFQNMINAFQDMNSVNYTRSFADSSTSGFSFLFEPTASARSNYPGVFANWSKQSEQQYFENLRTRLQSGKVPSLEFSTLTQQGVSADSVQFEATYQLTVFAQPKDTLSAKGRAQFFLVADHSRNWVIHRWIDVAQSPTDYTWSDLKEAFAQ